MRDRLSKPATRKFLLLLIPDDAPPVAGQYLVSIGKRGIGSVWYIEAIRKVKARKITPDEVRYSMQVRPTPEMKPFTVLAEGGEQVWVRGEMAYAMVWIPRGKKAKR